jgi:hypothetical protein
MVAGQDFAARITLTLKLKKFLGQVKLQVLAQSLDSLMSPGAEPIGAVVEAAKI